MEERDALDGDRLEGIVPESTTSVYSVLIWVGVVLLSHALAWQGTSAHHTKPLTNMNFSDGD